MREHEAKNSFARVATSRQGGGTGWGREAGVGANYNTALQVEAIEKPVWLKGSGLGRIRDASYRHIDRVGRRYEARVARLRGGNVKEGKREESEWGESI